MSNQESPPTVFISYSHDSPEHKRWVLEFAEELRRNGVDPLIDAWDLRPGDDVPKFMERGVRDSGRVLMICTEKYVAKANDGVGGVGYEAMIVTSELVRDLGTAKFIPIIRQNTGQPEVPTSVATRRFINLSEGTDRTAEMETLLRDLHSVPPEKPPLGRSPFAAAAPVPSGESAETSPGATSEGDEATQSPAELYRSALRIAESGDMLKWRRTVASARRELRPALKTWFEKYARTHPGEINALIEQSMEGAGAFAPLTAIALAGVTSGRPKFSNQIGLLEDILNPSEWERSGMVVRVELPETGAFAYQALLGSTCLHIGNVRPAIELARCATVDRKTGNTMPLWRRHDIIGWPEALGKNATSTWQVALGLSARWPWVSEVFSDESEYQAALYAYYVTMSFVEYVERVRAKFEIPEDPAKAHWWPDVPVFFEITADEIKRRGYQLILAEKESFRSWFSEIKVDESQLLELWPKWVGVQARILAQERAFWRTGLSFDRLIYDLLNK
jgi:TIR domain